jgi:hypothetical protein
MGPFRDGWTREDVEQALEGGDVLPVIYAPIVVGMNAPDCGPDWAESICLRLFDHCHPQVRANAATGIGHIVRTAAHTLKPESFAALERSLHDPEALVRAYARDAIEDLNVFLRDADSHSQILRLVRLARAAEAGGSDA